MISKLGFDLNEIENFKLTVSLHAPNEILRKKIIPINVSLQDIKYEVEKFKLLSHYKFEWNYVLLDGVNDSKQDSVELANFVQGTDIEIGCGQMVTHYNKTKNKEVK